MLQNLNLVAKLKFKKKCRLCNEVWVLVVHRQPIVCEDCKKLQK